MPTKLEGAGGGDKALVVEPLAEERFFAASLTTPYYIVDIFCCKQNALLARRSVKLYSMLCFYL